MRRRPYALGMPDDAAESTEPLVLTDRERKLQEQQARWSDWAATATTDLVPDRFTGEPVPGGVATEPMWFHADGKLYNTPPGE
jgi:hypothetical protein